MLGFIIGLILSVIICSISTYITIKHWYDVSDITILLISAEITGLSFASALLCFSYLIVYYT